MKRSVFFFLYAVLLLSVLLSCGQPVKTAPEQSPGGIKKAQRITIGELHSVLTKLQNRQLGSEYFGITANGTDCIYFIPDENFYAIEFEVIAETQKPFGRRMEAWARQHHYEVVLLTYNNKPEYASDGPAPVIRIEPGSDLDQTAVIGKELMTEVFGDPEGTVYDVVP